MSRSWSYNPSQRERELFEEWREYCIVYLISCKEGVLPGAISPALLEMVGEDIPLFKMGLPHPSSIRKFLYAMRDFIKVQSFQDRLFIFINDAKIPENKRHVRQMVKGQSTCKTKGRTKKPSMNAGIVVSADRLLSSYDSSRATGPFNSFSTSNGFAKPLFPARSRPMATASRFSAPRYSSAPVRSVVHRQKSADTRDYLDDLDEWDMSSSFNNAKKIEQNFSIKPVINTPVVRVLRDPMPLLTSTPKPGPMSVINVKANVDSIAVKARTPPRLIETPSAVGKAQVKWSYNPNDLEQEVFEYWRDACIDFLIICKVGVTPDAIFQDLKAIEKREIPLARMGLPEPTIRNFLYALDDFIRLRRYEDKLYVFINDLKVKIPDIMKKPRNTDRQGPTIDVCQCVPLERLLREEPQLQPLVAQKQAEISIKPVIKPAPAREPERKPLPIQPQQPLPKTYANSSTSSIVSQQSSMGGKAKISWRYDPSGEELKVFEKWQEVCIDYLISCKVGVTPDSIPLSLEDILGRDIPLDRMGLPEPTIRDFLYAMNDFIRVHLYQERLYVFFKDSKTPENREHVREFVNNQATRGSRGGPPIITGPSLLGSKYVPPERLLLEEPPVPVSKPMEVAKSEPKLNGTVRHPIPKREVQKTADACDDWDVTPAETSSTNYVQPLVPCSSQQQVSFPKVSPTVGRGRGRQPKGPVMNISAVFNNTSGTQANKLESPGNFEIEDTPVVQTNEVSNVDLFGQSSSGAQESPGLAAGAEATEKGITRMICKQIGIDFPPFLRGGHQHPANQSLAAFSRLHPEYNGNSGADGTWYRGM